MGESFPKGGWAKLRGPAEIQINIYPWLRARRVFFNWLGNCKRTQEDQKERGSCPDEFL